MKYSDVWLVIPCFNEATVIRDVIANARKTFPNIVAVDDGSKDGSPEQILAGGAHLVQHPVNLGQGAAIQTGVEYARAQPGARIFVTFDADGQHQVHDVENMIARLRQDDLDIVVGTRFGAYERESSQVPLLKRIVLRIVVALSPKLKRLGLSDAHNGLRVMGHRFGNALQLRMNGMSHASEFVDIMGSGDWAVGEEPVDVLYTEYSMSKGQSLFNGVNILADGLLGKRLD
ncbi:MULTISPECIES: glycosyltransferase family 2 protein [Corynebacterium]|jgi:glycosyltransferase|uniref:Glycosyltransferase family 2 protein n=1 Tax=Corynebacterium pseudodiphtheriticum TaxID=37637 RepID=A0ABT7FXL5_9CORY|nr:MULTISPECIES: glycosyltransferase family 2 protein [Corynebacterium]ERJ46645.1 glycosyl transferase [Corynebacterium pseudodiphtheriticum 090104]ERS39973.1 hypothetical protein HMPREF1292_00457 [Corynebacterium sp. KPL1995]ERS75385.1 hypothetical protein HMPREF1290_00458 [Corynebacterium sp. KPL1989]MCG7251954.1 glycosyltransferase family 2 protein [Corynebacterium pseudodiphtheriticum]MCT1635827.1 glycosyltransferase family 2 protein [Corynebacterium pseudodiphtheriticum]